MELKGNRIRFTYLPTLSVLACLSVIVLHCNNCFFEGPSSSIWLEVSFAHSFFYWPVPVFFMISGATLLDYPERMDTRQYLKRRVRRTLIPFLFWSFVGVVYRIMIALHAGAQFPLNVLVLIEGVANAKFIDWYWYFLALFSIYVSIPVFSNIQDKLKVYGFAVAITLLYELLHIVIFPQLNLTLSPYWFPPIPSYLMYPLLGYILSRIELSPRNRYIVYLIGFAAWFVHFVGTTLASKEAGIIVSYFKGYTNPLAVLQAASVFIFVKYELAPLVGRVAVLSRFVTAVSPLTLGIYLTQYYVMDIIIRLINIDIHSVVWRVLGVIPVFLVCAILTRILLKIRFTRVLVGQD